MYVVDDGGDIDNKDHGDGDPGGDHDGDDDNDDDGDDDDDDHDDDDGDDDDGGFGIPIEHILELEASTFRS